MLHHDYLSTSDPYLRAATTSPLTPVTALKFVRMLVLRRNFGIAQQATNVSDQNAKRLENLLIETGHIVSRNKSGSHPLDWLSGIQPTRWAELIRHADHVEWDQTPLKETSYSNAEIRSFIGPSRQVLLWKKEHFEFLKHVVDLWKLDDKSFHLFTNSRSDSILAFANENGFNLSQNRDLNIEGRRLQVDPARLGSPLVSIIDRSAVNGLRSHGVIRSSQEFLLIFLITLALALSARQSDLTT